MSLSLSAAQSGSSLPISIHLVDAFTSTPFRGNPAGVCVLDSSHTSWSTVPEHRLQHIALELNQLVAFVICCQSDAPAADGGAQRQRCLLRWFTPTTELDLCGHGTLAASHLLFSSAVVSERDEIQFSTRSGPLTARCIAATDSSSAMIELDFPADRPVLLSPSSTEYAELLPVLSQAFAPTVPAASITTVYRGNSAYFVLLPSASLVTALRPDFTALAAVTGRNVGVTTQADAAAGEGGRDPDFISRYFAPSHGLNEDPVTGSAHCSLAPLWAQRLGRKELLGYQASKRGGEVRVSWQEDRVTLRGRAVLTMTAQLLV